MIFLLPRIRQKTQSIIEKGNIKPLRNDIAFVLRRRFQRACHIGEHIFDKNAIPRGGVVDHHVGDRADELAVPDQGAAAQMCGG